MGGLATASDRSASRRVVAVSVPPSSMGTVSTRMHDAGSSKLTC